MSGCSLPVFRGAKTSKLKHPCDGLKPQFIGRILSNKSPYLNINYFSLEELGKSMILILYLEAGKTEVINT